MMVTKDMINGGGNKGATWYPRLGLSLVIKDIDIRYETSMADITLVKKIRMYEKVF